MNYSQASQLNMLYCYKAGVEIWNGIPFQRMLNYYT